MTGNTDIAPILRVALPTPLRHLFDYRASGTGTAGLEGIEPGMRVRVPFGRRRLVGVVMEIAARSELPEEKLRPVLERLDSRPIFDRAMLALLKWAAGYYHHPAGEVVAAALPKALRLGASLEAMVEEWRLTAAGRSWLELPPRADIDTPADLALLPPGWR